MILSFKKGDKAIRHFDNIVEVHDALPKVVQDLNEHSPLYAGGYPMSLLFAPRKEDNDKQIASGYYQDYDVYFPDEQKLSEAIEKLDSYEQADELNSKYETENAITYKINPRHGQSCLFK